MRSKKKIAITTGDIDGIGYEISFKALSKIKIPKNTVFFIFSSCHKNLPSSIKRNQKNYFNLLKKEHEIIKTDCLHKALNLSSKLNNQIINIQSPLSPPFWFIHAVNAARKKDLDGIVTAPMSKETIRNAGFKEIGHTELLKKLTTQDDLFMFFLGKKFSVCLLTDHIPLTNIKKKINFERVFLGIKEANKIKKILEKEKQNLPLALLALNPHAGENKIIGDEEDCILQKAIQEAQKNKIKCVGPIASDVAFLSDKLKKYSIFLALYHDQGLIPFRMLHEKNLSGIHITLGLNFIRTSVAHGTAKDIFKKNEANPTSMFKAIKYCQLLIN